MDLGSYYNNDCGAKDSLSSLSPQSGKGAQWPMNQYMMNVINDKDDGARVTHHVSP